MASKPRVVHLSSRSAKIFLHHSNTAPFGAVFLFLRRAANVSAEMEENGVNRSQASDPDIRRSSQSEVHAKSLEFRSGAKRTRPVSDKPKPRETSH